MEFRRLAEHFQRIEDETKRLGLVGLVVELLRDTPKNLVDKVLYLLQGRIAPDFAGVELGVAEKLTIRALARALGVKEDEIVTLQKKQGDLGLAAESVFARRRQKSFGDDPLTVSKVFAHFQKIAQATGAGSQETKLRFLGELLHNASPLEARYLVRLVGGKLRLGVADQTLLEALSLFAAKRAAGSVQDLEADERAERAEAKAAVEYAMDVTSDIALVAKTLLEEGLPAVRKLGIRLGVPIRPMLAERTTTLEEALDKVGGRAQVEYKYDGLRVQAHVGKTIDLFSRRLERITDQFPDIVEALAKARKKKTDFIVEGEAVAVDVETGRLLPFQVLSTRRGRKYGLGAGDGGAKRQATLEAAPDFTKSVPVRLFLFDVLYADGKDVTAQPLTERRELLGRLVDANEGVVLGEAHEFGKVDLLERYFEKVCMAGAEGIMIKNPASAYKAGSRGWSWIKFKADYQEGYSDSFDLVAVGAYWGQGRRGGWYGALLLASLNQQTGRYESVCRLATGFDDATLAGLQKRFEPFAAKTQPKDVDSEEVPDVWLEPRVVLEIIGAELTLSPRHRAAWGVLREGAGLSVRFPRFTGKWRDDKKPGQATTSQELVQFYERLNKARGHAVARGAR